MNDKNILRPTDLMPSEILGADLPLNAYWQAWLDFSKFAVPAILICIGSCIALVELGKRGADMWVLTLLAILAAAMIGYLVFAYGAYQKRVEDYDNRQQTRKDVVLILSIAIKNLTINNVAVTGRNNTVSLTQSQSGDTTATVLDAGSTQIYQVAMHMAEKAIGAWNANGGKRVTPKPFSAKQMSDELGIGGETWQDAIDLLNRASVLRAGEHGTAWRVLIPNMKDAERALHTEMLNRGFSSTWKDGVQSWYRLLPPTPTG